MNYVVTYGVCFRLSVQTSFRTVSIDSMIHRMVKTATFEQGHNGYGTIHSLSIFYTVQTATEYRQPPSRLTPQSPVTLS